jgi:D-glycerate 3-kinase
MRNLLAAGQVPADKAAMPKSRPATDARRARLSRRRSRTFLNDHKLPDEFLETAGRYYNPLAAWLAERIAATGPMVLGINGAQGTGKSTLAAWLKTILEIAYGKCVAVLSIDDFYLTKAQRIRLAAQVHPLFVTRGVPGTHDVAMAIDCIEQLRSLETGCSAELPRFDKSLDERAERASWPTIEGPVDLVILEGWCVGALPQAESDLAVPVNELEADADESGVWRRYVNTALSSSYRELFELLDALVFFKAPDFDTVLAWRLEQEVKLAETTDEAATGIMDAGQIAVFVQHFERLTRANLDQLPAIADVVLELDREHRCTGSTIDDNTAPD